MRGIVLAGGRGSRLYPLTLVTNKHLLPIYDEPMIFKVIKTLTDSGIEDITIVLGGESVGEIVRLVKDGSDFGAKVNYVYQQKPGGIAEALYLTKPIVDGHKIAVILGDNIFEDAFEKEITEFKNSDYTCSLFLKGVNDPQRFGVATIDSNNIIRKIVEKPKHPESKYAVTGLYLYDENIFNVIEQVKREIGYSDRGELEITDVNNYYLKTGKVKANILSKFWSDAGTIDSLLHASNMIKGQKRRLQSDGK